MAKWQIFALAFKGLKNSEVEGTKRSAREKNAAAEICRGKNAFCDFFLRVFHSRQKILGTLPHTFGIPFSKKKRVFGVLAPNPLWPNSVLAARQKSLYPLLRILILDGKKQGYYEMKSAINAGIICSLSPPALPKSNLRI